MKTLHTSETPTSDGDSVYNFWLFGGRFGVMGEDLRCVLIPPSSFDTFENHDKNEFFGI